VTSVSSLSDADVQAMLIHDDEQSVYQFALAVYVLDMTTRVDLVTQALLDGDAFAIGSTA
jgi:hypothetical protein